MTTTAGVSGRTATYGPVGDLGSSSASGTSSTTNTSNGTSSDSAASALSKDKDLFLKLLVAQMKYQDPGNPTDPSAFLSQTAQYTTVEKLNSLESLTQKVYDGGRQQTAASMIGRTVTFKDASGTTRTGVVSGVSVGSSTPQLTVGNLKVSLDDVSSVTAAQGSTP